MISSPAKVAVAAAGIISSLASVSSAQRLASATYSGDVRALKSAGCYSNPKPMVNHGTYKFQSPGNCQRVCVGYHKPVMGLANGNECWCGDLLPTLPSKVDDKLCDAPCNGYDKDTCGGYNLFNVYLTGESLADIPHIDPKQAENDPPETAAEQVRHSSTADGGPTTVFQTVPATSTDQSSKSRLSSDDESDGGTNTVGIVAGIVVGLVVLSAIVGGVFLFLRRRKRREAEENEKHQQVANFMESGRPPATSSSSMNDSRLDPDITQKRQSTGSIADNQDYSRKILQITNPDAY